MNKKISDIYDKLPWILIVPGGILTIVNAYTGNNWGVFGFSEGLLISSIVVCVTNLYRIQQELIELKSEMHEQK